MSVEIEDIFLIVFVGFPDGWCIIVYTYHMGSVRMVSQRSWLLTLSKPVRSNSKLFHLYVPNPILFRGNLVPSSSLTTILQKEQAALGVTGNQGALTEWKGSVQLS